MTRSIRFTLLALFVLAAALAAVVALIVPPPPAATAAPHWPLDGLTVRGAYHVHSTRSDGTGSVEEIAAAAARAGLQFVIITDHGDLTRAPDPPRYLNGVLCIDAVEINTDAGHLVAIGARASSYPLAGSAQAVVEDVHRLGGLAVAAHPGSPRASLRWTDWSVALDGLEWLNADSEWRDELVGSLGRLLLTYAFRPAQTLASTLDRPEPVMARWDEAARQARVVGLAGADAHARLGLRQQTEPYEGLHLRLPSYEASFGAFSLRVLLDAPLSGDPRRDAADIETRIRWGRVYSVIDGLAGPGAFDFSASSGPRTARMGDYLDVAGEVALHARMAAPPGTRMVVLRDGTPWFDTTEVESHLGVSLDPAVYRIELYAPGAGGQPPIPWVVSNPIYVGMRGVHLAARAVPTSPPPASRISIATDAWVAESSPGSTSRLLPRATMDGVAAIRWQFALAGGEAAGQYAAVRFPVDGFGPDDRLEVRARADGPMRLRVQVRSSSRGGGERWGQTLYLDREYRTHEVALASLAPVGPTGTPDPPLGAIDALLLVVDTLNTPPGTSGGLQIAELWLARP